MKQWWGPGRASEGAKAFLGGLCVAVGDVGTGRLSVVGQETLEAAGRQVRSGFLEPHRGVLPLALGAREGLGDVSQGAPASLHTSGGHLGRGDLLGL